MRKRNRKVRDVQTELNITAFMNLMVVLIPFLLITAVFSQVSILKLNLPGNSAAEQPLEDDPPMQLEVVLRKSRLVLAERNAGVISEFPLLLIENAEDDYRSFDDAAFKNLNLKLQAIKAQVTDSTTITILAEADTSYDLIIRTMDAVRLIIPEDGSEELPGELFPDVSIGSAPDDPSVTSTGGK